MRAANTRLVYRARRSTRRMRYWMLSVTYLADSSGKDELMAEFITPTDPRWQRFIDRAHHGAYHLPEYVHVAGHYERGEPVAFYVEDGDHAMLIPLLLRELPAELGAPPSWRDATSPYGYSGPIATPGIGPDAVRCSLRSLEQLARENEIVSAFIRLNPFRTIPPVFFQDIAVVVNHGPV